MSTASLHPILNQALQPHLLSKFIGSTQPRSCPNIQLLETIAMVQLSLYLPCLYILSRSWALTDEALAHVTTQDPSDSLETAKISGLPEESDNSTAFPALDNSTDYMANLSQLDLPPDSSENSTDDCRFMSFEEWKKHKQKDQKEQEEAVQVSSEPETTIIGNSLEPRTRISSTIQPKPEEIDQGKTYKDKFNYASLDCAATIVKTNSDAKGASAILREVKDSYLLNKCSTTNKFVVIELCQDILVTSVVMGNFELFSSMFKTVKFSVSDRFPVTNGWHELGEFEAENIRDVQNFDIENPLIWARYLKVEILTHYGNEFYCPISVIRVHGTTMMEEFKSSEKVDETSKSLPLSEKTGDTEAVPNYSTAYDPMDEECRVVLPYLALNEFLRDQNSSEICEVPLPNESTTALESSGAKTTEESLFRNIVKRLSLLESNASLSLLYVEEQSKLLSDAFTTMERRQSARLENALLKFNQSFVAHSQFLHQSLQKVRDEVQSNIDSHSAWTNGMIDMLNLTTRELSFQRKIIIVDTIIILLLVAYVFISRELLLSEDQNDSELVPEKRISKFKRQFPVHQGKKTKLHKKKNHKFL